MDRLKDFIKKYLYLLILLFLFILITFISYEYLKKRKLDNNKEVSKIYYQSINNIYSNEVDSLESLENISQSIEGFGLLAKMKIIENNINKKEFLYAYDLYKELIENKKLEKRYKDLIIVNAGYNLVDNIDNKMIFYLLDMTDINKSIFKSHLKEIHFVNSIKVSSLSELNLLNTQIQEDIEIMKSVKERINNLNVILQNKK